MKKAYQKEAPESIQELFSTIANSYDRTNALVSFNMHLFWNRALATKVINALKESDKKTYLDLCAGTGEIAFTVLEKMQVSTEIFLLDFCAEMLACAKEKEKNRDFKDHRIHYLQADAEVIPLPEASVSTVSIAYGIRNVAHPKKCLAEVFRILKPGGQFFILELTRPNNMFLRFGHSIYLKAFLPLIGRYAAANQEAYRYLSQSVHAFISPEALEVMLREAGFVDVVSKPLTGGIATLISGKKNT